MLDAYAATDLANNLDLDGIRACPLCLSELALAKLERREPSTTALTRAAAWTWSEIKHDLKAAVVGARMKEVLNAEAALRDLEEREMWRSPLVLAVVEKLAQRLADEIPRREII